MQIEYTPEEVRTLIEEHEALEYPAATAADVAEATDVLEGIEELVARLDPAVRREALESREPLGRRPALDPRRRQLLPQRRRCHRVRRLLELHSLG